MSNTSTHPRERATRLSPTPLALAVSALLCPPPVSAAPSGGIVTSGTATIGQAGTTTTISQGSQKAAINWQGFSIGAGETVNFQQPGAGAITLNRVVGNEQSVIAGALNANGKVFLINSAGVLFGTGSQVNVGGLVASTLDIRDEDFEAGNYVFRGAGSASVINRGTITVADGGYVALLGQRAINEGVVVATRGTAALAAGSKVTLDFAGDALLGVTLDQGALDALVDNRQAIYADGGRVFLTAKAADDLLGSQVNNSGIVQARTLGELKGEIVAYAYGGTAHIDGTLDASAPTGGDGGFVETSGDHVKIANGAQITTRASAGRHGTWLIDPVDFTIAASGGDMTGALLSSLLGGGNITIASAAGSAGSSGDINVNDAVTWSSDSVLTLTAAHDININNAITASGADAGLVLNYGGDYNIRTRASYSGAVDGPEGWPVARQDTSGGVYGRVTFSNTANTDGLTINGQTYTLIHSLEDLPAGITDQNPLLGYFALARDIDASTWSSSNPGRKTVVEALSSYSDQRGILTGLGHTISNLTLTATSSDLNVGFIGQTNAGAQVRDLGLSNVTVNGQGKYVGALIGRNQGGTLIKNVYSTGTVSGSSIVGGLVGYNFAYTGTIALIIDAWSSANVSGVDGGAGITVSTVGGLVGENTDRGTIQNSHASGSVTTLATVGVGHAQVGGLVGVNSGAIRYSYAKGAVTGLERIGGLVGYNNKGSIGHSFAQQGAITGRNKVAGLVGESTGTAAINGQIVWSYAEGDVTATNGSAAGLVATNGRSQLTDVYASGTVRAYTAGGSAAGLVGSNNGTITRAEALGDVWSEGSAAGLAVGNGGTIDRSSASGNVTGEGLVSGLVGQNTGAITNSHATGSITGTGPYVGQLVGRTTGSGTIDAASWYRDTAAEAAAQAAAEAAARAAAEAAAQAAARAAAEAAAQAAADAAAEAAAEAAAQALLQTRADAGTRSASTTVADMQRTAPPQPGATAPRTGGPGTVLDDHIVFTDARQFSADIQSIEVGGVIYRLDGGDDDRGATPDASQAPR